MQWNWSLYKGSNCLHYSWPFYSSHRLCRNPAHCWICRVLCWCYVFVLYRNQFFFHELLINNRLTPTWNLGENRYIFFLLRFHRKYEFYSMPTFEFELCHANLKSTDWCKQKQPNYFNFQISIDAKLHLYVTLSNSNSHRYYYWNEKKNVDE